MRKAVALISMLCLTGCERHPSDQEMIDAFHQHRSEFIELRDVARQDLALGFDRIEREYLDADWENDPPEFAPQDLSSMPEARRQSYRLLMDRLGVEIITMWSGGVQFLVSSVGLSVSGSLKAYSWMEEPPTDPVVESLDEGSLPVEGFVTNSWFFAYRPIEPGWYLHFSSDTPKPQTSARE